MLLFVNHNLPLNDHTFAVCESLIYYREITVCFFMNLKAVHARYTVVVYKRRYFVHLGKVKSADY